jgi:glycosyltransferase involved in cell wall biosynthesis
VLPSPIPPGPPPSDTRERAALCYAGNPEKKGLDLAVAAWASAARPDWPLYVTGIDAEAGQTFLRRRGLRAGENIVWCGRMEPGAHRELSARVEVHLAAARSDEFAGAQLEALVDGAVLVSVPSAGPIVPLALARQLDPSLVATEISAAALATCVERAFSLSSKEREAYRRRAADLMTPYTRTAFKRALSEHVLPSLFAMVE